MIGCMLYVTFSSEIEDSPKQPTPPDPHPGNPPEHEQSTHAIARTTRV